MLTFTTDYGGQADSALRRTWLHQQLPTTFHLLLTFAPLRLCVRFFFVFEAAIHGSLGPFGTKSTSPVGTLDSGRSLLFRLNRRTRGLKFSCTWSAENILAETILVGGGNANESIDT
jgi:hypothetical protein